MANLLQSPDLWVDGIGQSPPTFGDASGYSFYNVPGSLIKLSMQLIDGAPTGATIECTLTNYAVPNGSGNNLYLVVNGTIVETFSIDVIGTTTWNVDIPEGASVLIALNQQASGSYAPYGLDVGVTPPALPASSFWTNLVGVIDG